MPRRNKRKIYTTGKAVEFFNGADDGKPECIGCAFAGYGGVCKTSDGTCLKSNAGKAERREIGTL